MQDGYRGQNMTNNKRKMLEIMPPPKPQLTNIAAQVIITAYTNKPPSLSSNASLPDTLRLLAVGLTSIGNLIEQQNQPKQAQADEVDKPREYLGPRK
jgi:hypothetical protein